MCPGRTHMIDRRQILLGVAGAAAVLATEAAAQTAPAAPETPFAVTYIEVEKSRADAARRLLMRYRDSLKDKGVVDYAVFEQNGRFGHFVIVEQWPSAKAREDNAASAAGQEFRAALAPLLVAPVDERPHAPLSVGQKAATPAGLFVVTHVDVVPTKREEGTAEIRKLVEA